MPDTNTPARRQAFIRRLLMQGKVPAEVIHLLTGGMVDEDTGAYWKVHADTVRRDLDKITEAWIAAIQDPRGVDAAVHQVVMQLQEVAVEARRADPPQYGAAVRALVEITKILGLRSQRWDRRDRNSARYGRKVDPEARQAVQAVKRARSLSDQELAQETQDLEARLRRQGVITGDRAEA